MAFIKLRPWPFRKDEVAELYWLCSPYQDRQGRWRFKAIFLTEKDVIVPVEFSWGFLPNLRLGQKYSNGLPLIFKNGVVKEIPIQSNLTGKLCNAFNLPANLHYLFRNSEYGKELLWNYQINGQTYYVSCLEIIRAYFARNKLLAYAMLKPNGLDLLIDKFNVIGTKVSVELSRLIPKNLLNDRSILHLLWLHSSKIGRTSWDAVYNNLLKQAISRRYSNVRQAFQQGLPLLASPPDNVDGKWVIRGVTKGQSTLIMEILYIDGLRLDYTEIEYAHPMLRKKQKVKLPRKIVRSREQGHLKDYELDEQHRLPKSQGNEESIEAPLPGLGFIDPPELRQSPSLVQNINSGLGGFNTEGSGGAREKRQEDVSFEDPVSGGEIAPGEFKNRDVVSGLDKNGFAEFSKVVEYIQKALPHARISSDIIDIPLGKKFSLCSDGARRKCACVYIDQSQLTKTCILEVLRSDEWDVSTMIIQPKNQTNLRELENCALSLIHQLMANGGHWHNNGLKKISANYKIDKLKHKRGDTKEQWGNRILKKCLISVPWIKEGTIRNVLTTDTGI